MRTRLLGRRPPPSFKYQWLVNGIVVSSSIDDIHAGSSGGGRVAVLQRRRGKHRRQLRSGQQQQRPDRGGAGQTGPPARRTDKNHETVDPTKTPPPTRPPPRSAPALSTQLTRAQHAARIATMLKHGYHTFRSPRLGPASSRCRGTRSPRAHTASAKKQADRRRVRHGDLRGRREQDREGAPHQRRATALLHRKRLTLTAGACSSGRAPVRDWLKTFVLGR